MIREEIGYSYNDVTIIPAEISEVGSRSECNPFYRDNDLPIFAAPMSSVISEENYQDFIDEGVTPVIPRSVPLNERVTMLLNGIWTAVSLQEFIDLFIEDESDYYETIITGVKYNVCVDIANGHMLRLYDICERAKRESIARGYELVIMTGNIANAETYNYICWCNKTMQEELGINTVDYIRCGIGAGSGCITASNVSTFYPMASLIDKVKCVKDNEHIKNNEDYAPLIIADGGIRNYSDVIKALALGADYVMIGSLFAKCVESCGKKIRRFDEFGSYYEYNNNEEAIEDFNNGVKMMTKFYGMASAAGQIAISGTKTKTAEGITKYVDVEFKLSKWCENMAAYIRSAMSYCNCFTLEEFIGNVDLIVNSISAINSVNK